MDLLIKGKIVFLPVEVKNRAWKAQVLLANYFFKHGYSIVIGSLWYMDKYASECSNNCVYIGKDFYKKEFEFFNKFKKSGHLVVAWDSEGLLYEKDDIYISEQLNIDTLNILDYIITWGDRQKDTIKKIYNSNKIFSLGNPRLDLLNKDLIKQIYKNENNYILKNYGKDYILINSNFDCCTTSNYNILVENSIYTNGDSEKNRKRIDEILRYLSELFPKFIAMIKYIAFSNPDKIIVIRPHPCEDEKYWKKIFIDFRNVKINKCFSVNPWISNAKLIIHSGCTTGFEATVFGKPVFSYKPHLNIENNYSIADDVSIVIKTQEEMNEIIKKCYSEDLKFENVLNENQKKLINYYCSFSNKEKCSENIVNFIDNTYQNEGKIIFNYSFIKNIKKTVFNKRQKDLNIEFEHVTLKECKKDFISIYKALKLRNKFKIYELEDNEFIIVNKKRCKKQYIKNTFLKDEIKEIDFIFIPFRKIRKCLGKIKRKFFC